MSEALNLRVPESNRRRRRATAANPDPQTIEAIHAKAFMLKESIARKAADVREILTQVTIAVKIAVDAFSDFLSAPPEVAENRPARSRWLPRAVEACRASGLVALAQGRRFGLERDPSPLPGRIGTIRPVLAESACWCGTTQLRLVLWAFPKYTQLLTVVNRRCAASFSSSLATRQAPASGRQSRRSLSGYDRTAPP